MARSQAQARWNLRRDVGRESRGTQGDINKFNRDTELWERGLAEQRTSQNLWGLILGGTTTAACMLSSLGWGTPACIAAGLAVSGITRTSIDYFGDDTTDEPIDDLEFTDEDSKRFHQTQRYEAYNDSYDTQNKMSHEVGWGNETALTLTGLFDDMAEFQKIASLTKKPLSATPVKEPPKEVEPLKRGPADEPLQRGPAEDAGLGRSSTGSGSAGGVKNRFTGVTYDESLWDLLYS